MLKKAATVWARCLLCCTTEKRWPSKGDQPGSASMPNTIGLAVHVWRRGAQLCARFWMETRHYVGPSGELQNLRAQIEAYPGVASATATSDVVIKLEAALTRANQSGAAGRGARCGAPRAPRSAGNRGRRAPARALRNHAPHSERRMEYKRWPWPARCVPTETWEPCQEGEDFQEATRSVTNEPEYLIN